MYPSPQLSELPWNLQVLFSGIDVSEQPSWGEGVTLYVLDSGVRTTHIEFEGRAEFAYDAIREWSYIPNDSPEDPDGHGTHVAGIAAGKYAGIAPQATIKAIRVLGAHGTGAVSDAVSGLEWIAWNGKTPGVVNAALGVQR